MAGTSGGPWIEPEQANKKLVFSEIQVDGPGTVERALPAPPVLGDYYHDVAVIAFRERTPRAVQPAEIRVSSSVQGYCKELNWHPLDIVDGDPNTYWRADPRKSGDAAASQWVEWHYYEPLAATSIFLAPTARGGPRDCELQAAQADGTFRTIASFAMEQGRAARIEFPETRASIFRLVIHSAWQPTSNWPRAGCCARATRRRHGPASAGGGSSPATAASGITPSTARARWKRSTPRTASPTWRRPRWWISRPK